MPATTYSESLRKSSIGEYYFSIYQSEEFGCKEAEERAKQNLITSKIGQTITHVVEQLCVNDTCVYNTASKENIEGHVSKITKKEVSVVIVGEHKLCTVELDGEVKKIVPKVLIDSSSKLTLKHGEAFSIKVVSNTSGGDFFLFNLYNDTYVKVYATKKIVAFKEITIPSNGTLRANVPDYTSESIEKIIFLHLLDSREVKSEYTIKEMDMLLKSIPRDRYGILSRFIVIQR
jgi:hypothetical protein